MSIELIFPTIVAIQKKSPQCKVNKKLKQIKKWMKEKNKRCMRILVKMCSWKIDEAPRALHGKKLWKLTKQETMKALEALRARNYEALIPLKGQEIVKALENLRVRNYEALRALKLKKMK